MSFEFLGEDINDTRYVDDIKFLLSLFRLIEGGTIKNKAERFAKYCSIRNVKKHKRGGPDQEQKQDKEIDKR
jgi:hypothetical protein